jgi:hypothetical protein
MLLNGPTLPLLVVAALGALCPLAHADTISWIPAVDGGWEVAANWNPARVPLPTDDAFISLSTLRKVTVTLAHTVGSIDAARKIEINAGGDLTTGNLTLRYKDGIVANAAGAFTATGTVQADGCDLYAKGGTINVNTLSAYQGAAGQSAGLRANSGGTLNLTGLTTATAPVGKQLSIVATGGTVNLPNLTTLVPNGGSFVLAVNTGGTLQIPKLTSMDRTFLTIGAGTIDTAQLKTLTNGTLVAAVGASPDLSGLTSVDGSALPASGGATISVPNVTTYQAAAVQAGSSTDFSARTAGSVVELSGLTSIGAPTGAQHLIYASDSGVVKLPALNTIHADAPGGVWVVALSNGSVQLTSGTLSLTNANLGLTSTGTITAGTIDLKAGALWTGTGTLTASLVNTAGTVGPDDPQTPGLGRPLALTGTFTQLAGGTLQINMEPTAFDSLAVAGAAALGGTLSVVLDPLYDLPASGSFEIMDIGGQRTGSFDGLPQGARVLTDNNGVSLYINYSGGDGNDVVLSTVPEPGTWAMLGGLGVFALYGWRRQRRSR